MYYYYYYYYYCHWRIRFFFNDFTMIWFINIMFNVFSYQKVGQSQKHSKGQLWGCKSKFAHGKSKSTQCYIFIAEVSLFCFDRSVVTLHRRASIVLHRDFHWPSLREFIVLISKCKSANTHVTELLGDFISKLRINIVLGFSWSLSMLYWNGVPNWTRNYSANCKIAI